MQAWMYILIYALYVNNYRCKSLYKYTCEYVDVSMNVSKTVPVCEGVSG